MPVLPPIPFGANLPSKVGVNLATGIISDTVNPDDSQTSNIYENNGFMEYLQGLLASVGQENVENRLYNAQQAQLNREFQAAEAQKQRDWQEGLSNTAYQRAVADLQKAGLNPILAYQQGGAQTPSGASTPSGSNASYQTGGGDTLSSLLQSFAHLISSAGDLLELLPTSLLKG